MNAFALVGFLVVSAFFAQGNCISINVQGKNVNTDLYFNSGAVVDAFGPPYHSYNGHSIGDLTYTSGKITVSTPGVYYIYASLRVHAVGKRYALKVNNRVLFYAVSTGSGTSTASGSYRLNQGDQIYLEAVDKIRVWTSKGHDNFGAFKIDN